MDEDTIAALSTPPGRGGIAVIRVSGPQTLAITEKVFEKVVPPIDPGRSYHGFVTGERGRVDEGILVFYRGPKSYTGEDLAEISIHSNPFIIEAVLTLITSQGARQALPGEFTYRAFKNGKMDLIQAESVNELIQANSLYFATKKFQNMEGGLSGMLGRLRSGLVDLAIRLETEIEFSEEQHLAVASLDPALAEIEGVLARVLTHSALNETLDRAVRVMILGKVNAGKSSLFNRLLNEERAITSRIPGTTRDYIKERLYLDGFPVDVYDVAGMNRTVTDEIEALGIERGFEQLAHGDGVILLLDATTPVDDNDIEIYRRIEGKRRILLSNKMDIAAADGLHDIRSKFPDEVVHPLSAKTGENLDVVFTFLRDLKDSLVDGDIEYLINRRQKEILMRLKRHLDTVRTLVEARGEEGPHPLEIAAEEIRGALEDIGRLTGEVSTEEILNGVFSRFCVGK